MRTPAALAAIPLLAGAVLGLVAGDRLALDAALSSSAAALLCLVAAWAAFADGSSPECTVAIALGCGLAGVSLGITAADRAYRPPLLQWFEGRGRPGGPIVLEGTLREDASASRLGPSLTLDVDSAVLPGASPGSASGPAPASGGVRLLVSGVLGPAMAEAWRAGRRVRVTGALRLPAVYLDPGVRDERRTLARRGIVLVGSVKSAALLEVLDRGSLVRERAAAVRDWSRARLAQTVGRWSARSAGVATAILIGDRTGLSDADTRRLQDAGTYHVIAISGGNIAILTALLLGTFRVARMSLRAGAIAAVLLLLAYDAVVVPSASVSRAVLAAVIYLTARAIDHRGPALNVLAMAAVAGVAISPVVVLDPGFLLSFGATFGILLLASRIGPIASSRGSKVGKVTAWAQALLWTTLAAEAALLPIGAAVFSRVTFAGLLLNFAAIPCMSLLQAASLAALALSAVHAEAAGAAGYVAHLCAAAIVESARLVEFLPGLVREVNTPAWWEIVAYYACGGAAFAATSRPRLRAACGGFALAAILVVAGPDVSAGWGSPSTLRIAFLDVGQGDSTLVMFPGGGRAMLVDAGGIGGAQIPDPENGEAGAFDIGARVVAPALRALGVRRLDVLAITHGDPDHIGGAGWILRTLRPDAVWEGVPVPPHAGLQALLEAASARGMRWRTVQAGDVDRVGDVAIRVLHPPLPDWERQRVRNEDSIVLEVRLGDVAVVLPGDIGVEGERAVLPYLMPAKVVILKAPHHGSATSSSAPFLRALHPSAVVFSAGRNNRFGHPAPAVLARYRDLGAAMFSTADDGAIVLETDGQQVWMRGWTGRSARFP